MTVDALGALRAYTEAQLASGTSVYVGELPRRSPSDPKHPPKAVVINPVGGLPYDALLQIVRQRIDAFFYAPTPEAADELRREVFDVWRPLSHVNQGTAVLHWITPAGGIRYQRDPDTEWPVIVETWVLQSAEQAAA